MELKRKDIENEDEGNCWVSQILMEVRRWKVAEGVEDSGCVDIFSSFRLLLSISRTCLPVMFKPKILPGRVAAE